MESPPFPNDELYTNISNNTLLKYEISIFWYKFLYNKKGCHIIKSSSQIHSIRIEPNPNLLWF